MKKSLRLLAFGFCCMAGVAHAELMPDEYLQKDYDNCMGGQTAHTDPQRGQYCECVRNGMRQWTVDEYGAIATEAKDTKGTPDQVAALAKTCISQALH